MNDSDNSQENKRTIDYNRIYSEEGINTVFKMFGVETISDAMVPTSQTFKCWVNGREVRQFVVESGNHYQFYETVINEIIDKKMGYEEAREFVKSVKKGLRQIQGHGVRILVGLEGS